MHQGAQEQHGDVQGDSSAQLIFVIVKGDSSAQLIFVIVNCLCEIMICNFKGILFHWCSLFVEVLFSLILFLLQNISFNVVSDFVSVAKYFI